MKKEDVCLNRLSSVLTSLGESFIVVEEGGTVVEYSDNEELLSRFGSAEAGETVETIFDTALAGCIARKIDTCRLSNHFESFEYKDPDDEEAEVVECLFVPVTGDSDTQKRVAVIFRASAQHRHRTKTDALFETVFTKVSEGLMIYDDKGRVRFVNEAAIGLLGYDREKFLAKGADFLLGLLPKESFEHVCTSLNEAGRWEGETLIACADGRHILVWLCFEPMPETGSGSAFRLVRMNDISEIERSRERLEFIATHDALTGLPNRTLLYDRLEHSVSSLGRNRHMGALLFIDVDDFKEVNDLFGLHIGDALLQRIAERIRNTVRVSDTFGRFGGDEFLLIAENINHFDEVIIVIQKIRDQFSQPLDINGILLKVTLSIGIAMMPDDGDNAEALIGAADKAMHAVKRKGKDGFDFAKEEHSIVSNEYLTIQRWTKHAIRDDAFDIVYQPQFSIKDGRLSGVEALLRCKEEHISDLPINKIISVAEESGVIHEIGKFVFDAVCRQAKSWRDISVTPFRVAINLSRKELCSKGLEQAVKQGLEASRIDPGDLEFEITESTFMSNSTAARKNIEALRDIGFHFSIDDFGTGYSSLSNLKEFKLDKLKIDRTFIEALASDENDKAIVSATISMAKKLGLTVVAEGVETSMQEELLRDFECDEVQGFYYSYPVPPEEITDLLLARNA